MNYVTSKDYEKLWSLVQEGKEIVCLLEGKLTYVTIARKNGKYNDVLARGIPGVSAQTKISFIQQCETSNLEFLPPDSWIKIESDKDLPPEKEWILASDGKEICHVFWNGEAWDDDRYFYNRKTFTHWKPLPEPPRE